jgi:F-type H+-transporting ATPase subunit b
VQRFFGIGNLRVVCVQTAVILLVCPESKTQAEYQQKLSDAQVTSEQIVKDAVARGQAREEEIIRQANRDAAAIMDKASQDIAQEKKKALNDAKNEIADISLAIAGKVVERELKAEDQAQLIDSFIDALGDAL